MQRTIFDDIVDGEMKSWKIWEDEKFLAFLTPFPNTPGLTVVIPKQNPGDYIFDIDDAVYVEFMQAVRTVAKLLEKAFETPRIAVVFEGTGVAHVHAKLYPLHGDLAGRTDVWSENAEFHEEYLGWLTTVEGPKMDEAKLNEIQTKILTVQG